MKIIKLESENIKRIKVVEIKPDGSLVVIGGENDQGKSSVLDSIEYALAGAGSLPLKPIRKGQKKARIVVDLGDIIVTRSFSDTGSKLIVSDKQGFPKSSPQALLDSLVGKLTFDPLAFLRMKSDTQLSIVREIAGVDTSKLEGERQKIYDERTNINREIKSLQAQLNALQDYFPDVPKEEISYKELLEEQEKILVSNQTNQDERNKRDKLIDDVAKHKEYMEEMRKRIKDLRAEWDKALSREHDLDDELNEQLQLVESLEDEDTSSVRKKISELEEINSQVRCNLRRDEVSVDIELRENMVKKINLRLESIEAEKVELLASSKLPIPGLTFDNEKIYFNGVPFEQASSSQQLKISTAMGFAANPKLKILLIRDGSLLDENNLKLLAEMAEKENGQLWLERVSQGKECQVILEDGKVKE